MSRIRPVCKLREAKRSTFGVQQARVPMVKLVFDVVADESARPETFDLVLEQIIVFRKLMAPPRLELFAKRGRKSSAKRRRTPNAPHDREKKR